jgi:hypothetical protein
MRVCFYSLAELLADMNTKGGRDPFVADLKSQLHLLPFSEVREGL